MHPMEGLVIHDLNKKFIEAPDNETAWKIVKEFIEAHPGDAAENIMWYMTSYLMKYDDEHIEPDKRGTLLFFFENFKAMNRALQYLYKNRNRKS